MKNSVAKQMIIEYYKISNPKPDDEFRYVEALEYLISSTEDPKYMCELAWYYCSKKRFDLEIKYLELAAEYDHLPAYEELGYIYYYGQHGEVDHKKAFDYFSGGAKDEDDISSLWCRYKLADMYHNGYYVEKNEDKYREIIEKTFEEADPPKQLNVPFPEVALRLAQIRIEDGDKETAVGLLKRAKHFMAERLSVEPFWGHISVMSRIIRLLYELTPFDDEIFDIYDLFYKADAPGRYSFKFLGSRYFIEISDEDNAIDFEGKWYRNFEEFCQKAELDGERLTAVYDDLMDWEAET